jgi:hypothetical protein
VIKKIDLKYAQVLKRRLRGYIPSPISPSPLRNLRRKRNQYPTRPHRELIDLEISTTDSSGISFAKPLFKTNANSVSHAITRLETGIPSTSTYYQLIRAQVAEKEAEKAQKETAKQAERETKQAKRQLQRDLTAQTPRRPHRAPKKAKATTTSTPAPPLRALQLQTSIRPQRTRRLPQRGPLALAAARATRRPTTPFISPESSSATSKVDLGFRSPTRRS